MDKELICIDTSVLIDYFRKKDKSKSLLVELSRKYNFSISVIAKLEILVGIRPETENFWTGIFSRMTILPLNELEVEKASQIIRSLKKQNKIVDIQDILIAATAIVHNVRLSTTNKKHFERISELTMVE
jgi:predicted nucleic acid-binding protein